MMKPFPKIIHFIWWQDSPPQRIVRNINLWKMLNPAWDVRVWTANSITSFVKQRYPSLKKQFARIPLTKNRDKFQHIRHTDCARLLLLDYFGGAYFDCDLVPLRPLDDFLADTAIYLRRRKSTGAPTIEDICHSAEPVSLLAYDQIFFREIHNMDMSGSAIVNGAMLNRFQGGGSVFGMMAEDFLKWSNRRKPVLDSFGTHAVARYLRKIYPKQELKKGIIVMSGFYAVWDANLFGQPPWFVLSTHDSKTGALSWGTPDKNKPWETR